jgi:hypothetical protein
MPVTTPDIKVANVRRLGGTVELVGESYQEAQAYALNVRGGPWTAGAVVEGFVKGSRKSGPVSYTHANLTPDHLPPPTRPPPSAPSPRG